MWWNRNSLISCPAELQSPPIRLHSDRGFFYSISEMHAHSIQSYYHCVASVARLRSTLCPSHVSRFVISVVIDTIQRKIITRSRSDMGKEFRKIVNPFRRHSDAAASVILPFLVVWIKATLLNSFPCHVFWRAAHSMFMSTSTCLFSLQTTATSTHAFYEQPSGYDFSCAAFTDTMPAALTDLCLAGETVDRPSSEASTADIKKQLAFREWCRVHYRQYLSWFHDITTLSCLREKCNKEGLKDVRIRWINATLEYVL